MRVVFLDIDGVLNSLTFMRDLHNRSPDPALGPPDFRHQIDDTAVLRLNRLLEATGAVVVISSSWRRIVDLDELWQILKSHGFEGCIVGTTPDLSYLERAATRMLPRGDEIAHWLAHSPRAVHAFVILDDVSNMGELSHRLVLTDDRVGLTDDDVVRATALLRT